MFVRFNGEGHWSSPRNPSINRNSNSYVIIRVTMNNGINFIQPRNIYFLKIFIVIFICEVMYEGWYLTHMLKTLAWPPNFTTKGGLCPWNQFSSATLYWSSCSKPEKWATCTYMFMGIHFDSLSYFFSIGIWCCSDVIVLNVVNFIINFHDFIFNTWENNDDWFSYNFQMMLT